MRRRFGWCAVLMVLLSTTMPATGRAEEIPRTITLEQALVLAAGQNKDLQMALEYRQRVRGIYLEERAAALPQFTAQGYASLSRDETQRAMAPNSPVDSESYGGGVGLRQVLFTWGQVGAAIRAAEIGIQSAEDDVTRFRQAVARDVSVAFHDALLARELVSIARENLAQKERHLAEARHKLEAGTATDYDLLSAEVALQNARPEVIQAENLVIVSRDRLGVLLGLEGRRFAVAGELSAAPRPAPDYDGAVGVALAKRPELTLQGRLRGIQEELITIARGGDKPRLDFQGSYGWGSLEMGDSREDGVVARGEIVLTYPFFDGFRSDGRVLQARSELRRLQIEEEKLRDGIRLQVSEALSKLEESSEILSAIGGTVTQARRLLEMAELGFTHGVKTNLDVQDAQLNLRQARGQLAKARRDHLAAAVTLDWVTGSIDLPVAAGGT